MPGLTLARLRRFGDAAIPFVVGGFLVLLALDARDARDISGLEALVGIVLAVIQGGALWWRRSRPELVMAVALAGGLGTQLLVPDGVFPFAGMFAIGSLAAVRPPSVSVPALIALMGLTAVNFATGTTTEDTLFAMGIVVIPWALGEAARNRRAAIEEGVRRAVTEEQARIARELHDVIAHSVSVIVVQAGAADDVFDARPDQARAALRSIESAGRDAMRELRRLLAVVRTGGDDADPTAPLPGLDRLDELAAPLRAAGLEVSVRRVGAAHPLPAGVDLSAYRIVQEALTNTLRHARATRAEVTVRYAPDLLEVDVLDNGPAGPAGFAAGAGHGIVGMRERVAMLGGTLDVGPKPGGGFRVHAHLPLEPTP